MKGSDIEEKEFTVVNMQLEELNFPLTREKIQVLKS